MIAHIFTTGISVAMGRAEAALGGRGQTAQIHTHPNLSLQQSPSSSQLQPSRLACATGRLLLVWTEEPKPFIT